MWSPKLKTDAEQIYNCTFWYMVDTVEGVVVSQEFLYTDCISSGSGSGSSSGSGGSGASTSTSAPPPPQCKTTGGTPPPGAVSKHLIINVTQPLPPPPGGFPPPTPQPCPVVAPIAPPVVVIVVDPCAQKNKLNATAANAAITKENQQLATAVKSSTIEQGFAQNLQSLTGSTYNTTPVITSTAANADQLITTFDWNSTNGYTIGFTHDHPNGSGPSPADIFSMLINSQSSKLTSAGSNAVSFYKSNASLTVVTATNNYVVTINSWPAVQTLYNTYLNNITAFDNTVKSNSTLFKSYEASILNTFGNSINLYSDNGTPGKYYTLTANTLHNVSEIPCP